MSTLAIASAGTIPGVTTTALALTMAWARPVMLVEADVSKPSAVVAGLLQGALPADAGLMGVAQTAGIEAVTEQDIWDFSVPLPQQSDEELGRWLLPALSEPAAARQMRSFWTDLLRELRGLDAHPMDAIVDLGRIEERHGRHDLILDTDHLALVVALWVLPTVGRVPGGWSSTRSSSQAGWALKCVQVAVVATTVNPQSRRAARSSGTRSELPAAVPLRTNSVDAVESSLERKQVQRCLGGLTALQRESINLAYYSGYTQAEVSAALNVPLGTIKSRTYAALKALQQALAPA